MKQNGATDATIEKGKVILTFFLGFGKVKIILEFVFYIVLFRSLAESNKSMMAIVQQDILKVILTASTAHGPLKV